MCQPHGIKSDYFRLSLGLDPFITMLYYTKKPYVHCTLYSIPPWVTISSLCGSLLYPHLFSLVVPYAPSIFTVWGRPGRGQIHLSSEYRGFIMEPWDCKVTFRNIIVVSYYFHVQVCEVSVQYINMQHRTVYIHAVFVNGWPCAIIYSIIFINQLLFPLFLTLLL
jgi:hypothetical protein